MKFLRLKTETGTTPCAQLGGTWKDISTLVQDIDAQTIPGLVNLLSSTDTDTLPDIDPENHTLAAPMARPGNIYCIGLNYSDHAAEAGMQAPKEPILFNKSRSAYCGPNDDIPYSENMTKLDWEVELGVIIGKDALHVSEADAPDHVFGYTVVNDVSERAWQTERSGQWSKGKSFVNFCPTGPMIVTGEDIGHGADLPMWLDVNGKRMQTGRTSKMIFTVPEIISHLSTFMKLEAGDLICTGTPPGVGMGMSPQTWLKPGDRVQLGIEGLGAQDCKVVTL